MNTELVIEIGREGVLTVMLVAAPMLAVALVVGLMISIFQAATQLSEATLTFVPKIVAVLLALFIAGPWCLQKLVTFFNELMIRIPTMVR